MASVYLLCNCYMLDSDYNHTVDFNTKESQLNWFLDKVVYRLDDSMYQRKSELEIRVDKPLKDLATTNYLVVLNDDDTRYFYFITNEEYVNDYTTTLTLQLDLIQTYLFLLEDYNFTTCLVERQHVKRWNTFSNGQIYPNTDFMYEDEGLDTGDYELKSKTTLYDYTNKGSFIITSSEPLGNLNGETRYQNTPQGSGGIPSEDENYLKGYMNEIGLWALKSYEGYCSVPYQDNNGYWTVGYGVTQAYYPNEYEYIVNSGGSEYNCAEVLGDVAYNFSSYVLNWCKNNNLMNWINQNKFNALTSYVYQIGYNDKYGIQAKILSGASDVEIYNYWRTLTDYSTRRQSEAEMFIGNPSKSYLVTNWSTSTYLQDNGGKGHIPNEYKNTDSNTNRIEKAVNWAIGIALDNSKGYDQNNRWGPDYDCSSLVIQAWEQANVPLKTNGATYTGNMKNVMLRTGFEVVTDNTLKRGDVLLNEVNHTALYIGEGEIVEASINENGDIVGGQTGDQTGHEIHIRSYYSYPWDCVLRYKG